MEGKPRRVRKRVSRKKAPFFKRKSQLLKVSYGEVSIFLFFTIFFLIGLFHKVIYNYLSSFF